MPQTPGIQIVIAAARLLTDVEQDELARDLQRWRVARAAAESDVTARAIDALRRVADEIGKTPTVEEYRLEQKRLLRGGEQLPAVHELIRVFGSWRRAKEAIDLAEVTTSRRIEERFRKRRLGKVWQYTEETLRETVQRCGDELGRAPMVAEFAWWRQRELEFARSRGDDALHLPSPTPYRRRWGTWERGLRACGFDEASLMARLDPSAEDAVGTTAGHAATTTRTPRLDPPAAARVGTDAC